MIKVARAHGFFSVWFVVFERHIDVRLALIGAPPGTAASCFDEQAHLVNRPGATI